MKTRLALSRCLSACLPAAAFGLVLVAGTAWAQSAADQSAADASDPSGIASDESPGADASLNTFGENGETAQEMRDAEALRELRRDNIREEPIDGIRPRRLANDELTPGIRVGTFIFRPTLTESLGTERRSTGRKSESRTFLQTGLKGSLVSDWSLHQLTVDMQGSWQKTLSGETDDDPEGRIDAALKLDLSDSTIANLRLGYSLEREDVGDPNAVSGAAVQSLVSTYTAGAAITHDMGLIRATLGIDLERETYGDVKLSDGTVVRQSDRNANTAIVRGRLGYELSPALIPFLEASYGKMIHDNRTDSLGYRRDADLYAARAGVELDFGEKLRGEIGAGYTLADFDDPRLKSLAAVAIDGSATWSPRRGTDVVLGLKTEIEPSTTAGASGSVAYQANAALTQAILNDLSGRLSSSTTFRDYSAGNVPNQWVYNLGAGLTWNISRSLDLTTDAVWERSTQKGSADTDVFTAGIGLSLKR